MNVSIYKQLEIKFWDLAIQTLSENQQVRSMIRGFYQITHSGEFHRTLRILAASAVAGLASGAALCVFSLYIR